jgi:NAD(P) transhydrogenase subunit beta
VNGFDTTTHLLYLAAAVCFVVGLHLMTSPVTARRGNLLSGAGMSLAVLVTVALLQRSGQISASALAALVAGLGLGGAAGLITARRVAMTAMPQLISLFNAAGGGAAALIALGEAVDTGVLPLGRGSVGTTLSMALDVLIGGLTLSGSLVAAGKLAGLIPGRPLSHRLLRPGSLLLTVTAFVVGTAFVAGGGSTLLYALALIAVALGAMVTLPIGGADMPVVISLLNACTGTAVGMAGFVLDSTPLIIAGALVGAAGTILTVLMAEAMNRSVLSVLAGGYGTDDGSSASAGGGYRILEVDDAALQLAYASKVVIVPGYGLAAAQAQHEIVALAAALSEQGVDVNYGIHPVAGRMPGHMNVLLAEANAPYTQMLDLEAANAQFPTTDVVLVVGANDVTNPAARRPGNPVSGMPILNVDRARSVVVIKRSMAHGYAGMDNELYAEPGTAMLFGDAKEMLTRLATALRAYRTSHR